MRLNRCQLASLFACGILLLVFSSAASAQVASALLHEDEALPGGTGIISSLNNSAQNSAGGYAFTVTTDVTTSQVWGNASGGTGAVLVAEGTYGDLMQTSFESFFGISDDGTVGYSAGSNHVSGSPTGLDGMWTGTSPVLNEEDPIVDLPGNFSTFNSRPGMTADGQPYWVGGYSDTQGGSTQNRALFLGNSATILLKGGDNVTGVSEALVTGSAIDFDSRVSELGSSYITVADVDAVSSLTDLVMVSDGAAMMAGGGIIREGSPVPASIGGLAGENYSSFDFLGINEAGDYLITGDTSASTLEDEFVMVNGVIVLREGDAIGPWNVAGAIEGGYLNKDGDWAVAWDVVDSGGSSFEALIVNGELALIEGDAVDWNADGVIDALDQGAVLDGFTGITSLTLGSRVGGTVVACFTGDTVVNGSTVEGAYRMPIPVDTGIVAVESFQVTAGQYVSGTIAELATSDNADVTGRRSPGDIQGRVHVEFKGTSAVAVPTQFEFTLEASVFARSNVVQRIDLWNYDTSAWEEIDVRNASRFTDAIAVASPAGDVSRFVEPGTMCVEARVRFVSDVQRQQFSANLDHAFWTIED